MATCNKCDGSGKIICDGCRGSGKDRETGLEGACYWCKGVGYDICSDCNGTGQMGGVASSSSSSAPTKPESQHIVIKFAPSTSSGVIGKCPVCGTQMTPLLGGGKPFCYKCKNAKLNAREGIALIEAKQYEKAIPLLEESAACGNEQAMYNIGVCYYNGFGVKKDIKKSTEWIKKAADKGHEIAKDVINDIKINKIIFGVNLAGDLLETILSGLSE